LELYFRKKLACEDLLSVQHIRFQIPGNCDSNTQLIKEDSARKLNTATASASTGKSEKKNGTDLELGKVNCSEGRQRIRY